MHEEVYGLWPVSSVSVGLLCGLTCLLFVCRNKLKSQSKKAKQDSLTPLARHPALDESRTRWQLTESELLARANG